MIICTIFSLLEYQLQYYFYTRLACIYFGAFDPDRPVFPLDYVGGSATCVWDGDFSGMTVGVGEVGLTYQPRVIVNNLLFLLKSSSVYFKYLLKNSGVDKSAPLLRPSYFCD